MAAKHFTESLQASDVMWLGFSHADRTMNILSEEVLLELNDLLSQLSQNRQIKGLVIHSLKEDHFIAGADIADIEALASHGDDPQKKVKQGAAKMQAVLQKIAELPFPTVCAIHGTCLGGGLELALACDFRIASHHASTRLGFPEVQLGLLPGAGGTQRLPRLIGIIPALDLITSAKRIDAKKALRLGVVHAVVGENQLLDLASRFAQKKTRPAHSRRRTLSGRVMSVVLERNPLGKKIVARQAKKKILAQSKGFYPAPLYALRSVLEGIALPLNLGLKIEAKHFATLAMTEVSRSLIHLFHATSHIKKTPFAHLPGQDPSASSTETEDAKTAEPDARSTANTVKTTPSAPSAASAVTIIGAGFMGAGIATLCAYKNVSTIICDPSADSIGRALKYAYDFFQKRVRSRRMKPFAAAQACARISPGHHHQGFTRTDLVIEAVFEDLELKRKILLDLEQKAPTNWVFASNTSALPIADIAQVSRDPSRVIGMHFFSPAEKMPLLEIVRTPQSSHAALHRGVRLGQQLGKQVIVVRDGPGFYTTRALAFYLAEAICLLQEGASILTVDRAMTRFGFPVGPFTLLDEVGIDVGAHVLATMVQAFGKRMQTFPEIEELLKMKKQGKKNGHGIYLYKKDKKSRKKTDQWKKTEPDSKVEKLFATSSSSHKSLSESQIQERMNLIFINESLRCLDDGVLDHAYDGDVGAVFGLGYPPFRGGPFRYVDSHGAKNLLQKMKLLMQTCGARYEPAQSLQTHAENGTLFFPGISAQ